MAKVRDYAPGNASVYSTDDEADLDPYDHETEAARKRRTIELVSVKNCTVLLCTVCIVATATICIVLAVRSTDDAISKKGKQCDSAIADLTTASQDSIENIVTAFLGTLVEGQAATLQNYFDVFKDTTSILTLRMESARTMGVDHHDWSAFVDFMKTSLWASVATMVKKGLTGIGILNGVQALWIHENDKTISNPPDGVHQLMVSFVPGPVPTEGFRGMPVPYDGFADMNAPCCPTHDCAFNPDTVPPPGWNGLDGPCLELFIDQRQHQVYTIGMNFPWFKTHEARWAPASRVGDLWGISTLIPWGWPNETTKQGVVVVGADLRSASRVLKEAASRVNGSSIRLFTVTAVDVFLQELGPQLAAAINYEDQAGFLTGVSHGESLYAYYDVEEEGRLFMRRKARQDWNASDNIISQVAVLVDGDYGKFESATKLADPLMVTLQPRNPPEPFYVRTTRVQQPGLDWWLVCVLDRVYVMGAIDARIQSTQASMASGAQEVDDDIDRDRFVLVCIIVGVALALFLLSVVLVLQVVKPIGILMAEMEHVSKMQIDKVDEERPMSSFAEVHSMEVSFRQMITNLHEFRKYMPASILEGDAESDQQEAEELAMQQVRIPAPEGEVTLVFTDIKGSTSLWEQATEAMSLALKQHNSIIRKALVLHNGYEVKTVGDAFFAVFQDPEAACRFAVDAQADLASAEWHQGLAECGLPQAAAAKAPAGHWLWNGVRIRIGIHTGACALEVNPTTKRADYFGPPVNIAARLEAAGVGGFVGISDTVVDKVGAATLQEFCGALVPLGSKELKGVGKPIELMGLLPKGLEGRKDILGSDGKEIVAQQQVPVAGMEKKKKQGGAGLEKLKSTLTASRAAAAQVLTPARWTEDSGVSQTLSELNTYIGATDVAADRTEGMVQSCVGSSILVTWNAGKKCMSPQDQAFIFCSVLHKRFKEDISKPWIGVAGCVLLHGNLGKQGARKFATVIGAGIDTVAALSKYAKYLRAYVLGTSLDRCLKARELSRPVGRWLHPIDGEEHVLLELDVCAEQVDDEYGSIDQTVPQWNGQQYIQAFQTGDHAAMLEYAEKRPDDTVAPRVASELARGSGRSWWLTGVKVPEVYVEKRAKAGSHGTASTRQTVRSRESSIMMS